MLFRHDISIHLGRLLSLIIQIDYSSSIVCFSDSINHSMICFFRSKSNRSTSSKHFIIFIYSCLIFQWIFFSHREIIHFIYIQYPFQVWMPTNSLHKNHRFLFPSSWQLKINLLPYKHRFIDIGKYFETGCEHYQPDCADDKQPPVLFLFSRDNALPADR